MAGAAFPGYQLPRMHRVRRLLSLLALGLALTSQVGAALEPQSLSRCEQACDDGDETGHCPPTCECACLCHAPRQAQPAPNAPARRTVVVARAAPSDEDSPAAPEPEPIRHVPKLCS